MWNWNSAYDTATHSTDDPRILAVIRRDTDGSSTAPDGDAYAPAYWLDRRRFTSGVSAAGSTFTDDDTANAYAVALDTWGEDVAARFVKIFHDSTVEILSTPYGDSLLILNTPAFRAHVGIPADTAPEIAYSLDGDVETWRAYLDGDVFGVGWASNPARVLEETPVPDVDDLEASGWEIELECWGHYGEEYAQSTALAFEYGSPSLPLMLELTPA